MSGLSYLDASALVKLIVDEPESRALNRWYIEADRLVTSRIGVVETVRATDRRPIDEGHRARILSDVEIVELTPSIAASAFAVHPPTIRTLHAIHLATAIALLPELASFVTYDDRLASAARELGLPLLRPAGD